MATKAVEIEKIKQLFEKAELPEQVAAYQQIKQWMAAKVQQKANDLEEEKEKYLSIKDTISK